MCVAKEDNYICLHAFFCFLSLFSCLSMYLCLFINRCFSVCVCVGAGHLGAVLHTHTMRWRPVHAVGWRLSPSQDKAVCWWTVTTA